MCYETDVKSCVKCHMPVESYKSHWGDSGWICNECQMSNDLKAALARIKKLEEQVSALSWSASERLY